MGTCTRLYTFSLDEALEVLAAARAVSLADIVPHVFTVQGGSGSGRKALWPFQG